MKKRDLALILAGAAGAAIAAKMILRKPAAEWDAEQVAHAANSHFTYIDGMRVHFQEFGSESDPTVLLIHGYTASTYVWRSTAPLLAAAGFRVLAIDLIGFGYSDKPGGFEYTIGSQADIVVRFLDRLGIGQATMVGSSYGGAVAASAALDHPERVAKLILVGAVINDEAKEHILMRMAALPLIGELLTPFVLDSRSLTKRRMYTSFDGSGHGLIDDERVNSVLRPLAAADAHRSVLATARNWHADRIEDDLGYIQQPTLIIWGDNDRVIRIENGYKLHSSVLHSKFVVIRNCGHIPQEEHPRIFTDLMIGFIKDPRAGIRGEDLILPEAQ